MSSGPTDNRPHAVSAKVELRARLLQHVTPSHVLDCYCGQDGAMYEGVWHQADRYEGIDLKWQPGDHRRRFWGDTLELMRSLDLGRYTIFDVDAWGDPWPTLLELSKRMQWEPGKLYGVAITDGHPQTAIWGNVSAAVAQLAGVKAVRSMDKTVKASSKNTGTSHALALCRRAVEGWLKLSGLEAVHAWSATSKVASRGMNSPMRYSALVVRKSDKGQ